MARLDAEQTLARAITFPPDVVETAAVDPRLAEQIDKERALFEARRDVLVGQVQLLRSRREKVAEEIVALRAQIVQASESMKFRKSDLETNKKLLRDGFISAARIAQLESAVADYGVKIEERRAELARAQQRAVDADLRIRSLERDYRQQASDQRKATAARLSEIEQERRKSLDASARRVITAPASGEIIDLKYSTPGAVIPPRETIADIVPEGAGLLIEARVRTEDINRVRREQPADVRLTAFQYRTTHLVHGSFMSRVTAWWSGPATSPTTRCSSRPIRLPCRTPETSSFWRACPRRSTSRERRGPRFSISWSRSFRSCAAPCGSVDCRMSRPLALPARGCQTCGELSRAAQELCHA
ncbi:type I secretion membrane fusion protein, HlyD family [Variovorax sp. HW608]|uniref:HlyD family efflux transporter periplasmic adaptor subunit n=1 Tax=Variovorax sp. HW608 TaxID=1034889 RepID=UPI00081FCDCE|nr:HlyD family efflux transporter periplasmic adaptor subunit [Variovorax sp. HW608]SCK33305.1 type I secretion membrane fusion protein, HlyD family [Variovorax sp. HW608]